MWQVEFVFVNCVILFLMKIEDDDEFRATENISVQFLNWNKMF